MAEWSGQMCSSEDELGIRGGWLNDSKSKILTQLGFSSPSGFLLHFSLSFSLSLFEFEGDTISSAPSRLDKALSGLSFQFCVLWLSVVGAFLTFFLFTSHKRVW